MINSRISFNNLNFFFFISATCKYSQTQTVLILNYYLCFIVFIEFTQKIKLNPTRSSPIDALSFFFNTRRFKPYMYQHLKSQPKNISKFTSYSFFFFQKSCVFFNTFLIKKTIVHTAKSYNNDTSLIALTNSSRTLNFSNNNNTLFNEKIIVSDALVLYFYENNFFKTYYLHNLYFYYIFCFILINIKFNYFKLNLIDTHRQFWNSQKLLLTTFAYKSNFKSRSTMSFRSLILLNLLFL